MEEKRFIKMDNPALAAPRLYEVHNGDVLYCNTEWMEKFGYYYELTLGQTIYLHSENNNILEKGIEVQITKVFKDKKYPNKKWWQFWIKQEETVTGYHLMII